MYMWVVHSFPRYMYIYSHRLSWCYSQHSATLLNKHRLYNEVKVSMEFIILSDEVARLINAIETVPRFIMYFYHPYWRYVLLGSYLCLFSNYIKRTLDTQIHNLTTQ